ncbi:MAG: S8 family peptidase [Eubacteriales bacterium]|nr:S8 family peptidase [Eubacteriales bacterium]
MSDTTLQDKIYSNDYFDIILPLGNIPSDSTETTEDPGFQLLGAQYSVIHYPLEGRTLPPDLRYPQIPKLYALLDTTSLEVSGILRVQNQPYLGFKGEGIVIGFIDTGIDYTLDCFRNRDGSTRLLGIWDQTQPSQEPPYDFGYGTEYSREDINRALDSDNPYEIVPHHDTNGHGTFLAGVACGSEDTANDFIGAAPESTIAVVKLKPAKQNLRDYFLIRRDAIAFQETDIMLGIRYLMQLARSVQQPLVICISLGSNQGAHSGSTPLERYLSYASDLIGCYCCVAAGNEAGLSHHYHQTSSQANQMTAAELLVDDDTPGFMMEIWADSPDLFGVSVTSPLGETIPRIPPRIGTSNTFSFVAERTILNVTYEIAQYVSGSQLITLRFENPTPGIWKLNVTPSGNALGSFHMWLPVEGFISPGTVFLNPDPFTTLTSPSTSDTVITVSTYDAYSGMLFQNSSRGYTRVGAVKPDLAAPGVNVYGPAISSGNNLPPLNPYTRKTGSSIAAAITCGSVALLLNWNFSLPQLRLISTRAVKDYLTRGAIRQENLVYPNREWGYGALNLYRVFETLM